MDIRNAKREELPFIREKRVAAYSEHAVNIPEGHWAALKQAISSSADEMDGAEVIVADIDGEIAGSVVLFPPKTDAYDGMVEALDHPEIRMLAVTPTFRGKGVARALVKACIERAQQHQYTSIGLHTADFMTSAMSLYASMGFERLPKYDFEPAGDGIIVKAFRRRLSD